MRTKLKIRFSLSAGILLAGSLCLHAQTPPPSTDWPATIDGNAMVNYYYFGLDLASGGDGSDLPSTPTSGNWVNSLADFAQSTSPADQGSVVVTLAGLQGLQFNKSYMNISDQNYPIWASQSSIDVLLLVYGNDALYNPDGSGKQMQFTEGVLGAQTTVNATYTVPTGANNGHWNWMLFTITNAFDTVNNERYVGNVPQVGGSTPPGSINGGINGGTIRVQGTTPGMCIRALALGPTGAFGTSNNINVFALPGACDPEPNVNLAYVDINAGITNNLVILNGGDQAVTYQSGVGPAGDLRTAVKATGSYLNAGILNNYLGEPCNANRDMKVCVEFYDDPALVGSSFGPQAYASDSLGDAASYSGPLYTLTGSGKWLKVAFWVNGVNLYGINTTPMTGGPRLIFNGTAPFIDRLELGIARTGTNLLAGLDPEPSYYLNPNICSTNYGYFVELDLQKGITNGLTIGNSGGDQQMTVELAGPANDKRLSEVPINGNANLQFAIIPGTNGLPPFGPTYQDNADVLMAVTYYDDPALVGANLYPWPYNSLVHGVNTISFMNQLSGTNVFGMPYNNRAVLAGSGTWKTAYWELPNVNFNGVNQGPQSVVRFQTDGQPIHVTRVRYCIARPCGPLEGINVFQAIQVMNSTPFSVSWMGNATVQSTAALNGGTWNSAASATNLVTTTNSYAPPTTNPAGFFRLAFPHSPLP